MFYKLLTRTTWLQPSAGQVASVVVWGFPFIHAGVIELEAVPTPLLTLPILYYLGWNWPVRHMVLTPGLKRPGKGYKGKQKP